MPATIASQACALWEQAGRPDGRDQEFWLRAEAELAATKSAAAVPPITAAPPTIKDAVTLPGRPSACRTPKLA